MAIIDRGLERLYNFIEHDPFYRGNTVLVIAPDCGRDSNPFQSVPFQHHFNSRSAREVFALFVGPGVAKGREIKEKVEQIAVTPTIAAMMGLRATGSESGALEQIIR